MQTLGTGRAQRLVMNFRDNTGEIELVWFQGVKWIKDKVKPGKEFIIFGKPNYFNGGITLRILISNQPMRRY